MTGTNRFLVRSGTAEKSESSSFLKKRTKKLSNYVEPTGDKEEPYLAVHDAFKCLP
jgi:hypothetical protein